MVVAGIFLVSASIAWVVAAQTRPAVETGPDAGANLVDRGRYLAKIAGCNDCHTARYLLGEGKVPESEWLMGDTFGWKGPWGTTYASNLRIFMGALSEDNWVQVARSIRTRPPMPWFTLQEMDEMDLRALHRFVRSLGEVGEPAPAGLPPGVEPAGLHAIFPEPPPAD